MPRYYAPAFSIQVNGTRLNADVSANVQHVQVVSKPDLMDSFSFTLVNSLPDMRWTWDPDSVELFQFGTQVTILMGYVDDLHEMMSGEITSISPTFPGSGVPTVEIVGQSMMHRLSGCNKTRTFQKTKPHEIVQKVGGEAGFTVQAENIDLDIDYAIQANQSDMNFLKGIARQHHCELVVEKKKLIFRKARDNQPETMKFIWCGTQESFAPPPDTFPLISFSPQMNAMGPATTVQTRAWDPIAKQAMVATASSADQSARAQGATSGADVAANQLKRNCSVVNVATPFASLQEVQQNAVADFNNKALSFVSGKADTIGLPQLTAGQPIELSGLGLYFDGVYLTDEVTHSLGDSGYTTSFSVKSPSQGSQK